MHGRCFLKLVPNKRANEGALHLDRIEMNESTSNSVDSPYSKKGIFTSHK